MDVVRGCERQRLLGGDDAAFNTDGSLLATGSEDGNARIWDAKTSKELARIEHPGAVKTVGFSRNGSRLLTAGGNSAWLWNAARDKELPGGNGSVNDAKFSLDGTRLATITQNQDLEYTSTLWDMTKGNKLMNINLDYAQDIILSPQDSYLAAVDENTVYVWNTTTGQKVAKLYQGLQLKDVAFGQNCTNLATNIGQLTQIWDMETEKELARMNSSDYVYFASFSPDCRYLVTACNDNTISFWETRTGKRLHRIEDISGVERVEFSQDSKRLATTNDHNTSIVLDTETGKELARFVKNDSIETWAFRPDGTTLAIASQKTIEVWDVDKNTLSFKIDLEGYPNALTFSPDSRLIATAYGKVVEIWNETTGKKFAGMNHSDNVNKLEFSPNGTRLATASNDKTARIWDVATGQELARLNHNGSVNNVAFCPDGTKLATACSDNKVWIWNGSAGLELELAGTYSDSGISLAFSHDATKLVALNSTVAEEWNSTTGQKLAQMDEYDDIDEYYGKSPVEMVFSPDERYIATTTGGKATRVWNVKTATETSELTRDLREKKLAFSPDGRHIFMMSNDAARLLDTATGEELIGINRSGPIVFSLDGSRIAAKGKDNVVRIYDLNATKLVFMIPRVESKKIMGFNRDGTRLAMISQNSSLGIWDVDKGELLARFKSGPYGQKMAFTIDGRRLSFLNATYNNHAPESLLSILDLTTGEELANYKYDFWIDGFSPDGKYLATTTGNITKLLHYLPEDLKGEACSRPIRKNLTRSEWNTYLPGETYRDTCGCEECASYQGG